MSDTTQRCSSVSASLGEQLIGSAPTAVTWVALEQSGPWGAKAFTQSHLDPEVGRAIEASAKAAGVRPCLIRRPGRHADAEPHHARQVFIGHTRPGSTWLLQGEITAASDLLDLDWDAAGRGDQGAVLASLPALVPESLSVLLVCTNGTRDVCCASLGRPVAAAAAEAFPGRVWEATHTSGHRFAPTSVTLPSGVLHGRLDPAGAVALLQAADQGDLVLAGYRGRSTWPVPAQVAELAVRETTEELALDAFTVDLVDDGRVVVTHGDGRSWTVTVQRVPTDLERAESCGKALSALYRYEVTALRAR